MAYAFQISDEELAVIVASMNAVDPQPFPQSERVAFYRYGVQRQDRVRETVSIPYGGGGDW